MEILVLSAAVSATCNALHSAQLMTIAHVLVDSDGASDLAVDLGGRRLAAVRCVRCAAIPDHAALATMVAEGDFVWAGLVSSEELNADWPGDIQAFHVSELPRLVERLRELQRQAAP